MGANGESGPNGIWPVSVAGAVLAAIRSHLGRTQADIATGMGVARNTVQNWERGRTPLINLRYTDLGKLRRILTLAGASSSHLGVLRDALTADEILTNVHEATSAHEVDDHPLATIVPNRALTELLAWPITGRPPRQLADLTPSLHVTTEYRDVLAQDLRHAANHAHRDTAGAMVRRQAHYLLGDHQPSADWLAESTAEDVRAMRDLREWSPDWAVGRSRAIVAATNGNHEPMQRFLDQGLADDTAVLANLVYWAYWVGDIAHPWNSDEDMLTDDQPWSGDLLLESLLNGMVTAEYRELCVQALHALLRVRPRLVDRYRLRIVDAVDRVTSEHDLTAATSRRLDQIAYAHGS